MPTEPDRILCIAAHPDDIDFALAGTVATWTAAGIEVAYCVITDGDAGGFDPAVPRNRIGGIRRDEQRAAAAEVGVADVTFLGYLDGQLEVSLELRKDLAREIRRFRPQRVVCQSPFRSFRSVYRSHPDHLAAGEAALCAVYPDARNPFTFVELVAEGHEAWTVDEVWITVPDEFPHTTLQVIDVTEQLDRKFAALRAHASQHPDVALMETRVREWMAGDAIAQGLPPDRYAEVFAAVDTR
jgi:LmbE family N-acetylglucosaminyl deacetylase